MNGQMSMEIKICVTVLTISCAISVSGDQAENFDGGEDEDVTLPGLADIPDKYYDDLMKELPELLPVLAEYTARRNAAVYKKSASKNRRPEDGRLYQQIPSDRSKQSGRRIYQTYPYDYRNNEWERLTTYDSNNFITKKVLFQNKKTFPMMNCFWCGMNASFYVPTTSLCHDAFETSDYRLRALQRFFRAKCYYTNPIFVNFFNWDSRYYANFTYFGTWQGWNNMIYGSYYKRPRDKEDKLAKGKWGTPFMFDYGLKRNFFGQYIGGCFKRYLDVGTIYTQRGCKHYHPIKPYGGTSVGHRFKKLEYVLRWKHEGCVSSTQASLTPFNRGISLYARYHVCVCGTRYCNRAAKRARHDNVRFVVSILLSLNVYLNWIN